MRGRLIFREDHGVSSIGRSYGSDEQAYLVMRSVVRPGRDDEELSVSSPDPISRFRFWHTECEVMPCFDDSPTAIALSALQDMRPFARRASGAA